MLDSFNQTDVDYDDTQTIVSLFRHQAKATPESIAVVYKDRTFTYAEVDAISDRIAGFVAAKGLGAEDVVSVLIPRCEWMAIASLGVLKAGCAYQPLDPTYPKERLVAELPAEPKPESLFILLYTSGSTGVPKGCQLMHSNIVCFCHWYQRFYSLKPEHKVAAYASYGFDACMMDMYPALTCGATLHIVPEELRLDLIALNDYFEQNQITHSFMTTQVGYQFAANIENHSLKFLSAGGEKLASLNPPKGFKFCNLYGPTETTVLVTIYTVEHKEKDIPIGSAIDNMHLYIVDPQGHRLPVGAAGELWISGPQVSRGYLNRPEKTAEVYIDNPFTDQHKFARVYRSGDIVRYLPSGDIQFVGRRDGQVKIRGFRIELKEVEAVIREFPGIKDATVQAFDEEGSSGGKFIAAYIVSDQQIDIEALNNFIMDQKPPYAVVEECNAPMNVLEEELHEMIAGIVNNKDFGITTVLGYAGLTSISAIKLAVQMNKRFGVTLDSKTLVKAGTLQTIENEILKAMMSRSEEGSAADNSHSTLPTPHSATTPLSYAQTGVYFECLKNPTSTVYNIPYLLSYPAGIGLQE